MISTKFVEERFSANALVKELRIPDTSITSTSCAVAASCALTLAAIFKLVAVKTANEIFESLCATVCAPLRFCSYIKNNSLCTNM